MRTNAGSSFHTEFKPRFQKSKEPPCEHIMSRTLVVIPWDKHAVQTPVKELNIMTLAAGFCVKPIVILIIVVPQSHGDITLNKNSPTPLTYWTDLDYAYLK